ncbi:imm11 family protein [Melittangium boletus]|uniref:imm11 family protein n=1 Tax=Melittangium boletus TaxID=83453 RepID=UPI001FE8B0F1|nr:DUF1629 domain-containing protein [Melittangium boletus]
MARYFEWLDDRRIPSRWHLGSPLDALGREVDPWQFKTGAVLDMACVPQFSLAQPGAPLDFSWAAFSIPVVHERIVGLFERLRVADVQFIPTHIPGREEHYFVLNALRIVRCIDDARCKRVEHWTPEDERPDKVGEYRLVSGLKIDPHQAGNDRIFRPWGWRVALIIAEDLQQALQSEGITGTRFVEV